MGDQVIDLVELQTPSLVPGIAKERLGFDTERQALVVREMYTAVSRCQYSQIPLTAPPESAFEL